MAIYRSIGGWVLALTLPYALYYVADPMLGVEHRVLWTQGTQTDVAGVRARRQELRASRNRPRGFGARERSRPCCGCADVGSGSSETRLSNPHEARRGS